MVNVEEEILKKFPKIKQKGNFLSNSVLKIAKKLFMKSI